MLQNERYLEQSKCSVYISYYYQSSVFSLIYVILPRQP